MQGRVYAQRNNPIKKNKIIYSGMGAPSFRSFTKR